MEERHVQLVVLYSKKADIEIHRKNQRSPGESEGDTEKVAFELALTNWGAMGEKEQERNSAWGKEHCNFSYQGYVL